MKQVQAHGSFGFFWHLGRNPVKNQASSQRIAEHHQRGGVSGKQRTGGENTVTCTDSSRGRRADLRSPGSRLAGTKTHRRPWFRPRFMQLFSDRPGDTGCDEGRTGDASVPRHRWPSHRGHPQPPRVRWAGSSGRRWGLDREALLASVPALGHLPVWPDSCLRLAHGSVKMVENGLHVSRIRDSKSDPHPQWQFAGELPGGDAGVHGVPAGAQVSGVSMGPAEQFWISWSIFVVRHLKNPHTHCYIPTHCDISTSVSDAKI